jgi:hypothetical protein
MTQRYDQLAVTAMSVDRAVVAQRTYYCMRFPGQWKRPLCRLVQRKTGRDVVSISIDSLNRAVTALVPDCVATLKFAGQGNEDEDWLVAYREVDPRAIFALVAAWIRAENFPADQVPEVLTELDPSHLTWAPVTIDLDAPAHRHRALRLLAMDAAAALSAPGRVCPHGDLTFRRCAAATGAELISWPAVQVAGQTSFSALITMSAQTLPASDEVLVYAHFGVRRWVPVKPILSSEHGHNVYLEASLPYLPGLENSPHFGRAKIKRSRVTLDGESTHRCQWDDRVADVLQQAGCLSQLPDPEQLVATPLEHLQRNGHAAALVYSTGMVPKERVSAGLPVADREPLIEWVAETLAPSLRLVEPLPRVPIRVYRGLSRSVEPVTRAPALARSARELLGPRLDIELFTDTMESTRQATDALTTRLGVSVPRAPQLSDEPILVDVGPLTVGVRRPEMTVAASLDRGTGRNRRPVRDAVQARIAEIVDALPKPSHPTVALVEIGHPDN